MIAHRLVFLGSILAAGLAGRAAEETPGPREPAEGVVRAPPIFYLRDGGRLAGTPRLERLGVRTRYGLLEIPRNDLIQVRFAPRARPGEIERIRRAVSELAAESFDARERAMGALREAGAPARRILREAARSEDAEVRNRAEILLSENTGTPGDTAPGKVDGGESEGEDIDQLLDDEDDEVVTRRFTVRGEVVADGLVVESSYGELDLPASEIRGIVFTPESSVSRSLAVPASNTAPDGWLNTKVRVTRNLRLEIRAKGSLGVPNYNVTAGPEGTRQYSGSTFGNFPMLALIGKIGKNGKPFLVAREHQGRASREGTLYLAIVPFRRNYAATGSFQVRIEAKP